MMIYQFMNGASASTNSINKNRICQSTFYSIEVIIMIKKTDDSWIEN